MGECTIKGSAVSKSYDSKNWLLKFSSFLQEIPVKIDNYTITGYVHSSNNSKPYYYNDFEIKNSSINLKPLMGQIRNSTFYLDLDYNFSYKGINFTQNFFNNKNTVFKDTNSVFKVSNTGLPSIYITTANNNNGYGRYGSASGVSTAGAWTDVYAILPSEVETYGSIIWSSSGYDGIMSSRGQLPLFRLCPNLISNRSYDFWLRDVTYASDFALVTNDGDVNHGTATYELALRPRFLIK